MGFRIRSLHCAMFVLVFFAIAALPGNWASQIPGSPFGPATAWAGGTPDETLNPPPVPPQSGSQAKTPKRMAYEAAESRGSSDRLAPTLMAPDVRVVTWGAIWRIVRATVLRI